MNAATQRPVLTLGRDKGIGDIFFADARYTDGSEGRIVIYSSSLQGANSLLNLFSDIYHFEVISMS